MFNQKGETIGAVGIIRDITERKKIERAQKTSRESLQNIIEFANVGIIAAVSDRITHMNKKAEQIFGYSRNELIGKAPGVLMSKKYREQHKNILEKYLATGNSSQIVFEEEGVRKDGSIFPIEISFSLLGSRSQEDYGIIAIVNDILEKKEMEYKQLQTEKLISIGQLAAGIAHEINTPTQYVSDNTRFLQDAFSDLNKVLKKYEQLLEASKAGAATEALFQEVESAVKEADLDYLEKEIPNAIQQTLQGVEQVSKIVRSMKEFSHPGTGEKNFIDINKALENTITVSRNEWKYVAEIETDLDPTLPLVSCLPGELNQVFLNMIINAAHAIAEVKGDGSNGKGIIQFSTRHNGESVEIRISDTGVGIPEDIRSRVFDPFFTTKEVGKGTGQGLAISHSVIVEKHGGSLSLDTEVGKGTTFIIRLPIQGGCE